MMAMPKIDPRKGSTKLLNWLVCKALGFGLTLRGKTWTVHDAHGEGAFEDYLSNLSNLVTAMTQHKIAVFPNPDGSFTAYSGNILFEDGYPTADIAVVDASPANAVFRCFVVAKYGTEVAVPDEAMGFDDKRRFYAGKELKSPVS